MPETCETTRWTLSPETSSAAHESGLIVRYLPLLMAPEQEDAHLDVALIGKCAAPDGRTWAVLTTPALLYGIFDALESKHVREEAPVLLVELARQAGKVWTRHQAALH